jgi:Fungal specific transcription factor domain
MHMNIPLMGNGLTEDPSDVSYASRERSSAVSCSRICARDLDSSMCSDRGQPSCGWCARNDQICEYKERKKPGLRAGYGRDLERRLDRVEEMVLAHDRVLNEYLPTSPHSQRARTVSLPESRPNTGPGPMQPPSQAFEHHRLPDSPMSHVSANLARQHSIPEPRSQPMSANYGSDPHGTPHSIAIPTRVATNETSNADESWYTPQDQPSITASLPPPDLLYSLVDLFFVHINTWFPILHRENTFEALFSSGMLAEDDQILLHALVATTLRFSNDPRLTSEVRMQYHDSSKTRVLLYCLQNSSVRSLQAMVVLALDMTGSINGPPAWNLMALITRNVIHLGLSAESTSSISTPARPSISTLRAVVLPEPRSWIEDEERRRLFWGAYLLDRYATISTAFDFGLNEKDIDRRLPCDNALFSANAPVETSWFSPEGRSDYAEAHTENLGSFAFYCELLGIISRIHQFLKSPVDIASAEEVAQWQKTYRRLDDELASWKFSLPERLVESNVFQSSPESMSKRINACWIMLHCTYHTAVMRLHTSAAYPTFRSNYFKPSYNAIQRSTRAARSVEDLSRWVVGTSRLDSLGPPFAFTLWVAARVLLVHASTVEPNSSPDIGVFVSILAQMGKSWKVAERYGEILSRVVQEYQQSRLSAGSHDEQEVATVKILADMRR